MARSVADLREDKHAFVVFAWQRIDYNNEDQITILSSQRQIAHLSQVGENTHYNFNTRNKKNRLIFSDYIGQIYTLPSSISECISPVYTHFLQRNMKFKVYSY